MPGGVERVEPELAAGEVLAVLQPDVAVSEQLVPAVDDLGAGDACELRRPEDEVLLSVRLEHVLDREPVLARDAQVLVDVAARIDDGSLAAFSDDVGGMGNARRLDSLEEHFSLLSVGMRRAA